VVRVFEKKKEIRRGKDLTTTKRKADIFTKRECSRGMGDYGRKSPQRALLEENE